MRRDAVLAMLPRMIKAARKRKLPADAAQRVQNAIDWDLVDDAGNNTAAVEAHLRVAIGRAL